MAAPALIGLEFRQKRESAMAVPVSLRPPRLMQNNNIKLLYSFKYFARNVNITMLTDKKTLYNLFLARSQETKNVTYFQANFFSSEIILQILIYVIIVLTQITVSFLSDFLFVSSSPVWLNTNHHSCFLSSVRLKPCHGNSGSYDTHYKVIKNLSISQWNLWLLSIATPNYLHATYYLCSLLIMYILQILCI